MINSFVATAAAALSWMFAEWIVKGKPSLLGVVSGCVAGLVAVTPASGFAGPMGALVLGLVAGVVCLFFVTTVKNALGYDDALDVFGVHCIGGIVGAIGTGILVAPALGGTGIMDYATGKIADYDFVHPGHRPVQGGGADAGLVRRGLVHHLQGDRLHRSVCVRPSRRSAKASTSPTTASAPTTCKHAKRCGWGGYPAPPRPSGGLGRKTGASLFLGAASAWLGRRPMVNQALTSPPLWYRKA